MKNIFFAILLFAIIICGRGETIPTTTDNGVFSSLATKHMNLISSNSIKVNLDPDSTTISSIPDYLYKVLCVNNYLPGICDTVQCAIGLLGGETSSHIVAESGGVRSARKFESFFIMFLQHQQLLRTGDHMPCLRKIWSRFIIFMQCGGEKYFVATIL